MCHIFFHFIGGKIVLSAYYVINVIMNNSYFYDMIWIYTMIGILLSWLITENWNYKALWPIIICCNFPTAL